MKIGLLMESAEAHQKTADACLKKLEAHARGFDAVVREQIRCTLVDELQGLSSDARRAAEALRAVGQAANMRVTLWSVGVTAFCGAMALSVGWWLLPSQDELARLRTQREALARAVATLSQSGGRIDLRHCGNDRRLCVRVDREAPAYGKSADYYVVKGY
jgi:hypothetical protein